MLCVPSSHPSTVLRLIIVCFSLFFLLTVVVSVDALRLPAAVHVLIITSLGWWCLWLGSYSSLGPVKMYPFVHQLLKTKFLSK